MKRLIDCGDGGNDCGGDSKVGFNALAVAVLRE
jgi:hypothetical protein